MSTPLMPRFADNRTEAERLLFNELRANPQLKWLVQSQLDLWTQSVLGELVEKGYLDNEQKFTLFTRHDVTDKARKELKDAGEVRKDTECSHRSRRISI